MAHDHDHGHSHGHGHHHHHTNNKKALFISFILITAFMILEVVGGLLTNSLALLSDAGHMLSDAFAMGLSLFAFKLSEKAANNQKTFGYKRFEILAAFINGVTLLVISIYIFYEAYHRFLEPPNVSPMMLWIAVTGLVVNIIVAFILMYSGDTEGNLNMRSAFLHVLGDLLGSVGAIVAGILIMFFDWNLADPIASIVVALLILVSGYRVTRDSFHILMEGTPDNLSYQEIENELVQLNGVINIHDLHVWTITSDFPSLTCHIVVEEDTDRDLLLKKASTVLHDQFGIHHTTIQVEGAGSELEKEEDCCN
ncbi:cation diffusion facilitator family transporter [Gracilibacillus caseinilyticus]|uniref:Cation diffusion facilitator family transporter n=1 Tax=Gracilibacillus caseinilyticus TaxID=2932256 RepID=A0ABY4EQN8_9BACI|nr:cation diffusion facilitator family transporter [Gracilibacillus caseinilyticus]UOQ46764.1 cation diffusion facilitator family transporter [Gracilibacillus caseinilyticus]